MQGLPRDIPPLLPRAQMCTDPASHPRKGNELTVIAHIFLRRIPRHTGTHHPQLTSDTRIPRPPYYMSSPPPCIRTSRGTRHPVLRMCRGLSSNISINNPRREHQTEQSITEGKDAKLTTYTCSPDIGNSSAAAAPPPRLRRS